MFSWSSAYKYRMHEVPNRSYRWLSNRAKRRSDCQSNFTCSNYRNKIFFQGKGAVQTHWLLTDDEIEAKENGESI